MRFGRAARDDADAFAFELNVDHEQQPAQLVEAEDGIARLVVARRIFDARPPVALAALLQELSFCRSGAAATFRHDARRARGAGEGNQPARRRK
jgi:hypothetical protein